MVVITSSLDGKSARFSLCSDFINSIAEKLTEITLPEYEEDYDDDDDDGDHHLSGW